MFTGHGDAYLHCVLRFLAIMLDTCCTYGEEEHAVHSKRGVTRVEGQSDEERESNMRLHVGYLSCKIASLSYETRWSFIRAYRSDFLLRPGLCDVHKLASAVDPPHVSHADLGGAYGHEVGSWAANSELGEVGQRLADSRPKQEGAHDFVERSYILVEVRIRVNLLAVDQISLSGRDLKEETMKIFFFFWLFCLFCVIEKTLSSLYVNTQHQPLRPFSHEVNGTGCCLMS